MLRLTDAKTGKVIGWVSRCTRGHAIYFKAMDADGQLLKYSHSEAGAEMVVRRVAGDRTI